MRLEGKIALVTGGASGIGEAIVRKLALEGAKVYIADINDEAGNDIKNALLQENFKVDFVHLDVTDSENWKSAVVSAINQDQRLDILVNGAGLAQTGAPLEEMDLKRDWDLLININLNGTFYGMYTVIPYMKQQNSGSIVNISSVSSLVAQCGVTGYTAAKGGINALTRAAAVDYASHFVRCNAVCPTTTVTPAVQKIFDTVPGVEDALKADCVIPRFGKPEDIANTVAFLASDEAGYITGQILAVDGGYTAK